MNRIFCTISIILFSAQFIYGQKITFRSPEFESGVRRHLGIDNSSGITPSQLDTITALDLSGYGISDIDDVLYLPKLRVLNLSHNGIENVTPLAALDSLKKVDLIYNNLENIFALTFSNSSEMYVDVSFNGIKEFSCFKSLTPCVFTIDGVKLQREKNKPYLNVCMLYGDGTNKTSVIHGKIDSNIGNTIKLKCQNFESKVPVNRTVFSKEIKNLSGEALPIYVTNSSFSDSIYFVPYAEYEVRANETVVIRTGLPDNYTIKIVETQQGALNVTGSDLEYLASSEFDYEEVIYSYYWGPTLKGFSKIVLKSKDAPTSIDVVDDGQSNLEILLQGNQLCVKCAAKALGEESAIDVFDISGRLIASRLANSSNGINEQISLASVPRNVVVVQVTSGRQRFVDKIVVK